MKWKRDWMFVSSREGKKAGPKPCLPEVLVDFIPGLCAKERSDVTSNFQSTAFDPDLAIVNFAFCWIQDLSS